MFKTEHYIGILKYNLCYSKTIYVEVIQVGKDILIIKIFICAISCDFKIIIKELVNIFVKLDH
jgi:hypothetical protein